MDEQTPHPDRYYSWPKVKEITGLSRTTIWRLQRSGLFPKAVRISPGRIAWRESEIIVWLDGCRPRSEGGFVAAAPVGRRASEPMPREATQTSVAPAASERPAGPPPNGQAAAVAPPARPGRSRRVSEGQLSFGF